MAASDSFSEILPWLKTLPLAPEYHPTISEFQDPISYILKIEKEASKFGICKIVPPVPPPPRKTAISNLSRSLSSRNPNPNKSPTFTTRQQQIGFCPRKTRPVQKPVWQSGENYTLEQFEAKAKHFERSHLRKSGKRPPRSALEIETLFWKACADKPFSVEYANDMAGSAFAPVNSEKRTGETVGETAWNMRGVSRAKGSLLRFMKEEIPGVTSPMVYVAMLFSWFAWHVEDHDLHSLNYMHLGAAKTWYGVPKDAAVAFEEVVRVHGYGGEVNPLVTFATLGEKTTVMSPEVLINAGVPCCRLVQNAGEFVVTFPRAYHSGFSHGFNCGEAANIATPEWLRVAKEAAIRRASINYPPMVSHFQLLYALALNLCSRVSTDVSSEPWSPRLKNKKKDEGEMMVKEQFMQNVIQNNDLLHMLMEKGSSCILLPQNSSDISLSSKSGVGLGYQIRVKHKSSLDLCSSEEAMVASKVLLSDDIMPERNMQHKNLSDLCSAAQKSVSLLCEGKRVPSVKYSRYGNADLYTSPSHSKDMGSGEEGATFRGTGLNQGLLSCVTCGILNFACVAVIQPTEAAARYLVSSDCNFLDDHIVASDLNSDRNSYSSGLYSLSGQEVEEEDNEELVDVLIKSDVYQFQVANRSVEPTSDTLADNDLSALDLLASTYADSSDSEGEPIESEMSAWGDRGDSIIRSSLPAFCSLRKAPHEDAEFRPCDPCQEDNVEVPISVDSTNFEGTYRYSTATSARILSSREVDCSKSACGNLRAIPIGFTHSRDVVCRESDGWYLSCTETPKSRECDAELDSEGVSGKGIFDTSEKNSYMPFVQPSDKDSSRMHIFCLEHAVEVERQLHPIGGVKMLLLCHPDYPKLEEQAKSLAEEMGIDYCWNDISFREATAEDKAKIRTALDDEEVIPGNRDWAVKLGVNLYYSSNLSKSPLYCKQMPYNSVIYRVFGRDSPYNSPTKPRIYSKRGGKQKKLVVAGKWCGKVWMSNQVHPYLARRDPLEREPIKGFKSQSTDRKVEIRQEFENSVPTVAPDSIRQGRKRDIPFETVRLKKLKLQQSENIRADEDSDENLPPHCGRTLQSGTVRHERPVKNTDQIHSNLKNKIEGGLSTRLRKRPPKMMEAYVEENGSDKIRKNLKKPPSGNKNMNNTDASLKDEESEYQCNIEGCSMGFSSKNDLVLHKRNVCPVKGCGKKFFSHKYLVQHRRVHLDARPLKCPWKGCKMSFKWAWARTEHIRVHTGARPYVCRETGCGQTFRFVSDFSRHKRKTGHSAKKRRG